MSKGIVRIMAPRDGYRRAGMAHTKEPVDHPADRFTAEQLAQLKADKRLSVQELGEAAASGEGGDGKPEAKPGDGKPGPKTGNGKK